MALVFSDFYRPRQYCSPMMMPTFRPYYQPRPVYRRVPLRPSFWDMVLREPEPKPQPQPQPQRESIFDQLLSAFEPMEEDVTPWQMPEVKITQAEDGTLVSAKLDDALPKDNVKIQVKDGRLVLSAKQERKSEKAKGKQKEDEHPHSSFTSEFYQSFALPEGVDTTAITAKVDEAGVLQIHIPKPGEQPPALMDIPIQAAPQPQPQPQALPQPPAEEPAEEKADEQAAQDEDEDDETPVLVELDRDGKEMATE